MRAKMDRTPTNCVVRVPAELSWRPDWDTLKDTLNVGPTVDRPSHKAGYGYIFWMLNPYSGYIFWMLYPDYGYIYIL
jgi:hypothetical protein